MRVKLWGTRGSVPTPAAATARYGGNTPCVEVRAADGEILILDAGTGLHWLGAGLIDSGFSRLKRRAHLLITHTHWGHIQGLPFFQPMLDGNCRFSIYGSGDVTTMEQKLQWQMDRAYCPVPNFFDDRVGARVAILDIDEAPFQIGATRVQARRVNHAAGSTTFGYRLDNGARSLAYVPDVEYLEPADREPVLALADGVDLLIHDAHHTQGERAAWRGCGHASDDDAVAVAREAGVARLLLFHHHPDHDDRAIDQLVARHAGTSPPVEAAVERQVYALSAA